MRPLVRLYFLLFLIITTGLNAQKVDNGFSEKAFYFAAWGDINQGEGKTKATIEEQKARLKRLADAGITDLLPNASTERLRELVPLAKEYGIRVHAWLWMMNIGGLEEAQKHPEWFSVNVLGQNCKEYNPYVSYYKFLSPFSEGAREFIKKRVKEKAEIPGIASVHFDYIRFVDIILGADLQKKYKHKGGPLIQDRILDEYDFGYHPNARKQFKEIFGTDPVDLEDRAENPAWQQFRMNAITSLVDDCVDICHDKGVATSAAVFPFPQLAREYVRQDWGHWKLDTFFPMAYKKDHQGNVNWVGFATKEGVRDLEKGQDLITGILTGHYGDNYSDFEQAIQLARKNGAKGISFFTANSLDDKHLSIIKKWNKTYN
ncbi:family 10 glycosylhydrolase [Flagellimonas myxillae]|uniref:family 10 glycosylhydrolase n=1 Tax=Flagellimonas myxillae TaxID=2942214 RepID=UPI00201E7C63|nr:family 10 glycosylhydrolase [Muricauda myxillae]MCL6267181.1 family 10 glycosylhydrolase [Muricauda myxillae]